MLVGIGVILMCAGLGMAGKYFAEVKVSGLKRDESRHIAYGVFLISRLVAQDRSLWTIVEERMNELLPLALGFIQELGSYADEDGYLPFGPQITDYVTYAMGQFQKRVARIERAREQTLEMLYQLDEADWPPVVLITSL
jgi:ribonucleoside-diphosphate reductase beta chain